MSEFVNGVSAFASWAKDYWVILSACGGAAVWVIRRMVRGYRSLRWGWADLAGKVSSINAALGPNGGKSVVDRLERIENRQKDTAGIAEKIQARLNADQRTAAEPRIEMDSQGRVTVVNRAFERLTDRGASDIEGLGIFSLLHLDDRDRVVSEWNHAVQDRRWFDTALRLSTRDGHYRKARMIAEPMRAADGEVLGWLANFSPIEAG